MKQIPQEVRDYFAELGRKSKGGGRPRIPDHLLTTAQAKRRERDLKRKEKNND